MLKDRHFVYFERLSFVEKLLNQQWRVKLSRRVYLVGALLMSGPNGGKSSGVGRRPEPPDGWIVDGCLGMGKGRPKRFGTTAEGALGAISFETAGLLTVIIAGTGKLRGGTECRGKGGGTSPEKNTEKES